MESYDVFLSTLVSCILYLSERIIFVKRFQDFQSEKIIMHSTHILDSLMQVSNVVKQMTIGHQGASKTPNILIAINDKSAINDKNAIRCNQSIPGYSSVDKDKDKTRLKHRFV